MNSTHHPSFWPYDYRDRVVLGWKGLLVGVLVAHATFCALFVPTMFGASIQSGLLVVIYCAVYILFGAIPIWAVGIPVGAVLGKALRTVRNQWVHAAAFVAAGALAGALVGALFDSLPIPGFSACTAIAAGVGRLAVWKLVHINDHPSRT